MDSPADCIRWCWRTDFACVHSGMPTCMMAIPHFMGISAFLDRRRFRMSMMPTAVRTGSDGTYEFTTIRPGAYLARADIGRYRPAHVHYSLIGGRSRLITQMYFEGDEHLERDPAFSVLGDREAQERQVGKKEADGAYRFDIVIPSKTGKTVIPSKTG